MTIESIQNPASRANPADNPVRHLGPGNIQEFVCPVCRAKQVAQPECRRCTADLSLYLKALQSVKAARSQIELASINGNSQLAERAISYLKWLSPSEIAL